MPFQLLVDHHLTVLERQRSDARRRQFVAIHAAVSNRLCVVDRRCPVREGRRAAPSVGRSRAILDRTEVRLKEV